MLLIHGRAGGFIPGEVASLKAELIQRRGGIVLLHALTADRPPAFPAGPVPNHPLTLVPLFLLPGTHVRKDLPALMRCWMADGPFSMVKRLPFLGAWPPWQQAIAAEVRDLGPAPGDAPAGGVRLLHHPIEGAAPRRYLELLEARTGGRCLAATGVGPLPGDPSQPLLPLALASNRLTEQLAEHGPTVRAEPLLKRPRCRQALLESLVGVP